MRGAVGAAQFNCQAIECLEGQVAVAEPEVGLEQQVGMREAPVYRRRLSPRHARMLTPSVPAE
ncbi:MAG: hypothetical protein KFB96_09350 [Thiocapsa sp.]|uniref:hypothetical protein n=1 Tax=Thiocapsa sp. TaxID=2024551 RepID=UPI001BCBB438|nr:hypothetical protein [Thiocapsa sp.]QVL50598.1 MAG: hypothetical protein KFB96_09350 [Thiocapsa sp.]